MQDKEQKTGSVLVVGGGIAGMQASLDLTDAGFKVYLVEASPAIGGKMAQLDKTFPTNDCSMCIMSPRLVDVASNLNIELLTTSEVVGLEGEPGNFRVSVCKKPRYIDVTKCTGCGDCAKECPVELPSEFNMGLSTRKAIYKPYAQAVPGAFAIDKRGTSPCKSGCPLNISVQGYVALIAQGKFKEALDLIRRENPFPGICGRVCNHPCETECMRGKVDEPIAIASLKRFVADWEMEEKVRSQEEEGRAQNTALRIPHSAFNSKKVAIVGSGPAGLTAAYDLALAGYSVTVFEKLPVAGGMMRVGIPDYRLPQAIIQQEIDAILNAGVELKLNAEVDSIDNLRSQGFEAVMIATGAHANKGMDVPGENLDGVLPGVSFLREVNLAKVNQASSLSKQDHKQDACVTTEVNLGNKVDVHGKKVAVVGGGNVAIDAARVAVRLGAKAVSIIYRRSRDEMPADPHEIKAAEEEGIKMHFLANPTKINGQNGKVTGVECVKMELGEPDSSGRKKPVPIKGSEFVIDVDIIIPAIGQASDLNWLQTKATKWGTIEVDSWTLSTSLDGVFAAGDVVSGPAFVVNAIKSGHVAAESIDRYLRGLRGIDLKHGREKKLAELVKDVPLKGIKKMPRLKMNELDVQKRLANFDEVDLGFTEAEAMAEASRCLSCGICSECYECERVCQAKAVSHNQAEEIREIKVGGILLAPGFETIPPQVRDEYGYGYYPNVLTSLEFERYLSASGPTTGHVKRPSDGQEPKKVAWIQCVGSRDEERKYCSSVCCMYATKEAIIAKEHAHGLEPTIFFMDIRAFGKGFDSYYERAKNEYGVRYVRCMVSTVKEDTQTNNLIIRYVAPSGELIEEEFDMVVLSVGLKPSPKMRELADNLGVNLNQYGFCTTNTLTPVTTSKPGIFICGASSEPKDIPETAMQASGAAACVGELLGDVRGTEIVHKKYPAETDVSGQEPRIGVFVCRCGINIAGVVDVPGVAKYALSLPNVACVEEKIYVCSQDSQGMIKEKIREHNLNRVVVASCTPRTHERLFQDTIAEAGLNKYLFEMANVRDQCSWVHQGSPDAATEKAKELVRMAVGRAALLEPLYLTKMNVTKKALIIGGGLSGMTAALSLAEAGFDVELVEREAQLGGNLKYLYSTMDGSNPQEHLRQLIENVKNHSLIKIHLASEVVSVSGHVGHFKSGVRCQVSVNSKQMSGVREIEHGVVIVATGGVESKPVEYLYGQDERVVTQRELEEKLANPHSAFRIPHSVVMIQCVGSRDEQRPYCSRICCSQAIKNALKLKEINPETEVYILYRDMRTYGFREEYYYKAREAGIVFIRYDVDKKPEVRSQKSEVTTPLEVEVFDPVLQEKVVISADMVALAPAIVSCPGNEQLAPLLKVTLNQDRFFLEAHMKLRPVDFATEGMFLCGLAHSPKDISESIIQSKAVAGRAATVLAKNQLEVGGVVSWIDQNRCVACLTCIRMCPYNVPFINEKGAAEIEPAKCQGCGICASECPAKAIELMHYKDTQVVAKVDAMFCLR
ncbi:MAG: FAD-dependent oxidoreductase [bacterium]|nr:FAD-dependent oxidoreductase [bacterium]